ncbi:MAG: hypothetical protein RL531_553 [Actinomycetota bacterium]
MTHRPARRIRTALAGALLLVPGVGGVVAEVSSVGAATSAGGFVGVTPKRLLDTRNAGNGGCVAATENAGAGRSLTVTGTSPISGIGDTTVPTGASAVALNVTVVSPSLPGFVTVYPTGAAKPTASNVNYTAGEVVPNGVLVKVGTGGQINLFANAGCPQIIVDVVGYFEGTTPTQPGGFNGITPKRLLDTRNAGNGGCVAGDRALQVTGTSTIPGVGDTTVPSDAAAVALNVTVAGPTLPGFVTVYPAGATKPTASNVNYTAGQVVPNNVQVKVGAGGQINLFANAGCPQLIVDVVGYYTGSTPIGEGGFVGITPKRVVDTRNAGNGGCVAATDGFGTGRAVRVTGTSPITGIGDTTVPDGAGAVALNVTVVTPSLPGFLTVYPTGATKPTASTVNYVAGQVVPNGTVVKVGTDGQINLFANAGCPQVIVDVVGYYVGTSEPTGDPTVLDSWGTNTQGALGDPSVAPYAATPLRVGTATGWTAVSTNGSPDLEQSQTCGIRSGGLYCWGSNDYGQLGNGTTEASPLPVQVGSATNWQSVSVGGAAACAINAATELFCWGDNTYGQVGDDGAAPDSPTPYRILTGLAADGITPVSIGTGWANVDVAQTHVCAVRTTGNQLFCWGDNAFGQFGDGTFDAQYVPKRVAGSFSWGQVTTGDYHSCARNISNKPFCIGDNAAGQLGNGDDFPPDPPLLTNSPVQPEPIDTVLDWTLLAAGTYTSCGLRATGSVWCWGDGYLGSLGNGVPIFTTTAQKVGTDTNWTTIDVGSNNATSAQVCAVKSTGTLWCWGDGTDYKTGLATTEPTYEPTQVGSANTWSKVSTGYRNSCATRADGSLWCWGANDQGQLGVASFRTSAGSSPVRSDVAVVSTGAVSSCAILTSGAIRCWGSNLTGGLGDGTGVDSLTPVAVGSATNWAQVAVGGEVDLGSPSGFACATRTDGTLWCWGDGGSGQLGSVATSADTPTQVGSATDWTSVAAGAKHACGLRGAALYCWGAGGAGQLGDGASTNRTAPTVVPLPSGVAGWSSVSAGTSHSCAVTVEGRAYCWGANSAGQLGTGNTTPSAVPVRVGSATDWDMIAAGVLTTCGLRGDSLLCWGSSANGQVGDGATIDRNAPVTIGSGYASVALAAADEDPTDSHACAVKVTGTLWCWGGNSFGQLGDGTTTARSQPTQVGSATGWGAVTVGDGHTLALRV